MSITSSKFTVGVPQKDGRVWVTETHTDHLSGEHSFAYRALPTANHQAVMLARVAQIEAALAESEFLEAIEFEGWAPLKHQTAAQFAARLRARYKDASKVECAKLAKWILDRIDGGAFTETAVRTAFGLTAGQWTTLKAKLTTLRTNYNAVLAATGE